MSEMFDKLALNTQQDQPPVEPVAEANETPVAVETVADATALDNPTDSIANAGAEGMATELELPFDLADDSKDALHDQVAEEIGESLKLLVNRLSRVEGQIRGIKRMLLNKANIIDILIQSTAVFSAVNGFNKKIIETIIYTRVLPEVQQGNMAAVDELVTAMNRIVK